MPKPIPEIIVDVHEDNSGLAVKLQERNIGNVTIDSLPTGDVVINYNGYLAGFEIKRNSDYSNSMKDKRLSEQVCRMQHAFPYSYLIIEGWKPYFSENVTESELRSTVRMFKKSRRTFNRRLVVEETADMDETIEYITDIISNMKSGDLGHVRRPIILEPSPDAQTVFLCGLPNISVARANEILELFGCPDNALAHVDSWDEIKGITADRVERIKEVLGKERLT